MRTRGSSVSALALLWTLASCAGSGKPDADAQESLKGVIVGGVSASFSVTPLELGLSERLTIRVRLKNLEHKVKSFKTFGDIEQHITLRVSDGGNAKPLVPLFIDEPAVFTRRLEPGVEQIWESSVKLSARYPVVPGKYRLSFDYDTRLSSGKGDPRNPIIPWSESSAEIHLK